MNQIVQAATLLVMDKELLGDKEVIDSICPSLSVFQVKRLLDQFTADQLSPDSVSNNVKDKLESMCIKLRKEGKESPVEIDSHKISPLSLSFLLNKDKK